MDTKTDILIVEDSQTQALKLQNCLQRHGYQLHIAESGEMALDFLATNQPALIISDVVMPGMDGFELCIRIKNNPLLKAIPVILLTSLAEPQHILRGLEAKADYYFTKPYDTERLLKKIATFLAITNHPAEGPNAPALTVNLAGETHTVSSDPQVVLNLLVATYENTLQQNRELIEAKTALDELNQRLEEKLEELSESEDRFRVLVQTVPDIVFRIDCEGRFLFVNDAIEQIGYCSDELLGKHFSEIILPVDRTACCRKTQLPLFSGRATGDAEAPKLFDERRSGSRMTRCLEIRLQAKDEQDSITAVLEEIQPTSVYGEVNSSGLYQLDLESKNKTFAGTVGVIRDISDKKHSAMAVAASEERLRTALVDAPLPVALCAEDGEIMQVSKVWQELLGTTDYTQAANRLLGTPYRDGAAEIVFAELFSLSDKKDLGEYSLTSDKGAMLIWNLRVAPLPPLEDGRRLVILMATDMTGHYESEKALRAAKDEAERANKVKGEFLANMSHEIRTPMNAIMGMAHLCLQTDLAPQQQEYLKFLTTSAETLLCLIDDILDFSKIEANQLKMEAVVFNIDDVWCKLEAVLGNKAKEKGISLTFKTGPRLPRQLIGDPLRLGQVLINLVGNAIKFTEQGEITVTTEVKEILPERLILQFSVQDSGIGISSEQCAQLFKPFSQADPSITRQFGGTGLGLVISKKLVERMNGTIDVKSTPGRGSCFSFTAAFGQPTQTGDIHAPLPEAIRKLRVLVVDDYNPSQEILQQLLESLDIQVTTTASGENALELLAGASPPFDLVLMDWQLIGMDGIATSERIRQTPTINPKPKIILVSGHHLERVKNQAARTRLDGFLIKPVRRSTLLQTLCEIFSIEKNIQPPSDAVSTKSREETVSLAGTHVLVVEDNEINQKVAMGLLHSWQIEVAIANNGREAVTMAAQEQFDAILMDIQMPEMDGLTATRMIRDQEPAGHRIPIIAMTAHAMSGDREKSLAAGMDDQVNKPVIPDQLHSTLSKWITRKNVPECTTTPPTSIPADIANPYACLAGIINTTAGLARTAGNHDLYGNLLCLFRKNHVDAGEEMQRCLEKKDYETLRHLSHALKGVAGSVGAEKLQEAALALERASREKNHPEALTTLALVDTELAAVLEAINSLPQKKKNNEGKHNPADAHDGLMPLLERLANHLEEESPKAIRLAQSLVERGGRSAFEEDIQALACLIESYNFDDGLEFLRSLQNRMRTTSPTH